MSDMTGVRTPPRPRSVDPGTDAPRDGLATASLVLGIAGFLPVPGLAASVSAVILGSLSGGPGGDGVRRRPPAAVTGIALGCIGIGLFVLICIVYFGVLGYPLPQIHRYTPPAPANCSCEHFGASFQR
jgi:hypothetical protein